MASLQDQLLKAGLTNKSKANKANKDKDKKAREARKGGAKTVNEAQIAARKAQAQRLERDRELNLQKQREAGQKELVAQIKQLIEMNKIDREQGDVAYSFVHESKIKNIYVTDNLQKQLSLGRLAIVSYLKANKIVYELVPSAIAQKIAQRDEHTVVQINDKPAEENNSDDPYADYQIPDDLMW